MSKQIYQTGSYHYRKVPVLIIGVLLVGSCGFILFHLLPPWVAGWGEPEKLFVGLFPVGISGLFVFIGVTLLRYYFSDHRLELRIDDAGVHYGGRSYRWDQVGSISGRGYHGRTMLLLQRRGWSFDRHLQTDVGLTDAEYARLMTLLENELARDHPHLRIG